MSELTPEVIEKKIAEQRIHCNGESGFLSKAQYYKLSFRAVIFLVVFGGGFISSAIIGITLLVSSMKVMEVNISNMDKKIELLTNVIIIDEHKNPGVTTRGGAE